MTMNSSGPISLIGPIPGQSIQLELGSAGQISLNDATVRNLAGFSGGSIIMPGDFYGKPLAAALYITTNQTNLNLRTWALANGWNGTAFVNIVVNAGVYIYSTNTSTPGMTINGVWPNGVILTNNGYIMGMGGTGAQFDQTGPVPFGIRATNGGNAISVSTPVTIVNNSYIAGGGGGGDGGGGGTASPITSTPGGGGAGGGNGGGFVFSGVALYAGLGGGPGQPGNNGTDDPVGSIGGGGGGGRILPGVGGSGGYPNGAFADGAFGRGGGAGGGGSGLDGTYDGGPYVPGGNGGSAGAVGGNSSRWFNPNYSIYDYSGAGGGGWGATGGGGVWGVGGTGGKAIETGGWPVNYSGPGTAYGAISSSSGFGVALTANQTNLDLRTYALANGWNGTAPLIFVVNPGVYIYSTSTATPGLNITGSFPGGVTVYNQGFIMGMGGKGGTLYQNLYNGFAGGPAINLGVSANIMNYSYIGGGGGGGAMAGPGGGGGAGGGAGGEGSDQYRNYIRPGGVGGGPGQVGGDAFDWTSVPGAVVYQSGGGGGGRIMPGTGGAGGIATPYPPGPLQALGGKGGGAGGGSGSFADGYIQGSSANGLPGGSAGNAGAGGGFGAAGGGGGWGAAGGNSYSPYVGGAGGKAIALNGFTATITGSGTIYGAVS